MIHLFHGIDLAVLQMYPMFKHTVSSNLDTCIARAIMKPTLYLQL